MAMHSKNVQGCRFYTTRLHNLSGPSLNHNRWHGQIHKDIVVNPGLLNAFFAAKAPRIADQSPASIAFCTILPLPQALK